MPDEPQRTLKSSVEPLAPKLRQLLEGEEGSKNDDRQQWSIPGSVFSNPVDHKLESASRSFKYGAVAGLALWILLSGLVLSLSPSESFQEPAGFEQLSHVVTFVLLFFSNGSRLVPLASREDGLQFLKSGVMVGLVFVQLIAMASNLWMAFYPTPVVVDPIVGLRVHLMRWTEWIALAFLMSFLTTNLDVPNREDRKVNIRTPINIAASTAAGLVFPFLTNSRDWLIALAVSWILFCDIFVVLYDRYSKFRGLKQSRSLKRATVEQKEKYQLARSSFIVTTACCVTWTNLALTYTVLCAAGTFWPESWLALPEAPVVLTSVCEITSKVWYLATLVDAYEKVFDESTRALRRLEELRSFMSAVWESSSDVIVFSGDRNGVISARVSPAFLKMIRRPSSQMQLLNRGDLSVVLEIYPDDGYFYVCALDLAQPISRAAAHDFQKSLMSEKRSLTETKPSSIEEAAIRDLARLAVQVCRDDVSQSQGSMCQTFVTKQDSDDSTIQLNYEAKLAHIDGSNAVVILRDISDRVQRFEAEKMLLQEATIRQKDAEAIRFTRHEVKNGLLAALGLVDHLREDLRTCLPHSQASGDIVHESGGSATTKSVVSERLRSTLLELDSGLHDVLDTVLDEAMAREIIYGEYRAKTELIDVADFFAQMRRKSSSRYTLDLSPIPFPKLGLDRQLLRFIYRNAVSNASKYGALLGKVQTRAWMDSGDFCMEVINEPGRGHDQLLKMNEKEVEAIFAPGVQLKANHLDQRLQQNAEDRSTGNGAWIMQHCAAALKGQCKLRFEAEKTVFHFSCPVSDIHRERSVLSLRDDYFHIPSETWGIAIDDSAIQRKLLGRFLTMAGIRTDRQLVLGQNAEEVFNFGRSVTELMLQYPDAKFLLIVDENLDIEDGGAKHVSISGSRTIEQLRRDLDPSTERRMLALIRSANDSASDLDSYASRAHGYLLKEPIRRDRILGMIEPFWMARFNATSAAMHATVSSDEEDIYGPSASDIKESVESVERLMADDENLRDMWKVCTERMHSLKGDLKTVEAQGDVEYSIGRLVQLIECSEPPQDLRTVWVDIRGSIDKAIATSD